MDILKCGFGLYAVFIAISLFAIHYLCQQNENMNLYRLAMVNAGVSILMWIAIVMVLIYAREEERFIWILLSSILIIPLIIMLVLYVMAKRIALMYPSETMEVVKEKEYVAFDRTGDSAEWKMDEQSAPEQEKKSETRMETDF